jgi:hypothetical protein
MVVPAVFDLIRHGSIVIFPRAGTLAQCSQSMHTDRIVNKSDVQITALNSHANPT